MKTSNTKSSLNPHHLLLQAALFMSTFMSFSLADNFYIGGKEGWVQNPRESFNHWAGRHRFQIKDQIVFKYKKGEDSVFLVRKESYETCKRLAIEKLEDQGGESQFKFNRSGSFYFISGKTGHCEKGQKVVVVVMASRKKQGLSVGSPASSPAMAPVGFGAPVQSARDSASSSSSSSSSCSMKGFFGMVVVAFSFLFMF